MFWIIWTYLFITAYFVWQFARSEIGPAGIRLRDRYGYIALYSSTVVGAALWPVLLPMALWGYGK